MTVNAKELAQRQLKGCVITTESGLKLYTPDGEGNYHALWTRDFYYMISDAGELLPLSDIRDCLEFLFSHARASDGWMPDRVYPDGTTAYTAGGWDATGMPLPNLDNNDFAVLAAQRYVELAPAEEGNAFLQKWIDVLSRALFAIPTDERGLVTNDPSNPHSPYGFTDCICKTGELAMESLLHWQALRTAARWGVKEAAGAADRLEKAFEEAFFTEDSPLLLAATVDCRQSDIWASCFVLYTGFPLSERRADALRTALAEHFDEYTQNGQLLHTLPGQPWEKTFIDLPYGTYQNGAYWATPVRWLVAALLPKTPRLAEKAVSDALLDFSERGCCECINGEYRKLENYVASATAVYAAEKMLNGRG